MWLYWDGAAWRHSGQVQVKKENKQSRGQKAQEVDKIQQNLGAG